METEEKVKQCAVLIITCDARVTSHRRALERSGFRVTTTAEWPADAIIRDFHVVIVLVRGVESATMMAARMRAKPHFGQRVLIAVVPGEPTAADRRTAIGSGFDDVASDARDSRALVARVVQFLRLRPEYRCFLPDRKRPAA
jgi:DNA-binding response OmpR family regulator